MRSRCDMILLSNEGLSPLQIGKRVRFSQRYEAKGVAGLFTKPRSGRPRRVTPEYEAKLLEAVEQVHQQLEDDPVQVLRLLKEWAKLISS